MFHRIRKKICQFILGTVLGMGDATLFAPGDKESSTGFAILGGSGFGKSRLLQQICRELKVHGQGFTLIDPNNDTGEDLFAWLTFHHKELGLSKEHLHFLRPDEAPIAFDPFEYLPDADDPHAHSDHRYRSWFHGRIKDLVLIITRKQGETEDDAQKMVRLKRWLFNALYAVGIRQADGSHLTLNDAVALLSPLHADHEKLYKRVAPFLDANVRADFEKLRKTSDPRKQEDWVESSINRLREIDSPTMRLAFGGHGESFPFKEMILNHGVLIACLGKTEYFHPDEAQVYSALLIRKVSDVVRTIPREKRTRHYLLIDEAQNALGEDLIGMLKESRKYKLTIGLAVQQLDNLQKGEIDLVPTVLGICSMRITFRQKFHEHAEIIAQNLCFPLLVFKELIHIVERHGGYRWVTVVSRNFSRSQSDTGSVSVGESHTRSFGATEGVSHTESLAKSEGKTYSDSATISRGRSLMKGRSVSFSKSDTNSSSESEGDSTGVSDSSQVSSGTSLTNSRNTGTSLIQPPRARDDTRGRSQGQVSGEGSSEQVASGSALTNTSSHTVTTGYSKQRSRGVQQSEQRGANAGESYGRSEGGGGVLQPRARSWQQQVEERERRLWRDEFRHDR